MDTLKRPEFRKFSRMVDKTRQKDIQTDKILALVVILVFSMTQFSTEIEIYWFLRNGSIPRNKATTRNTRSKPTSSSSNSLKM